MSPDYPKISVIIPLFNKAKSIDRCLRSVVGQTVSPLEIIIVDDCSTDESLQRVRQQTNSSFRIIENETNCGSSDTRNRGVQASRGEWIAFLDADDNWKDNHLEIISNLIMDYSDVRMVGTDWYKCCGNHTERASPELPNGIIDYYSLSMHRTCLWPTTLAVRRDLFDEIGGFDSRIRYMEEFDFFMRAQRVSSAATSSIATADYHYDAENRSDKRRVKEWRETAFAFWDAIHQVENEEEKRFRYLLLKQYCLALLDKRRLRPAWVLLTRHYRLHQLPIALAELAARYIKKRTMG